MTTCRNRNLNQKHFWFQNIGTKKTIVTQKLTIGQKMGSSWLIIGPILFEKADTWMSNGMYVNYRPCTKIFESNSLK